jgi:hypothetical protein
MYPTLPSNGGWPFWSSCFYHLKAGTTLYSVYKRLWIYSKVSCAGGTGSLCLQISTRWNRKAKHTGLSPQRERCIICSLPRKPGVDICSNLVTFTLSVWPKPKCILLQTLIVTLAIHRIHPYHMYFTKMFVIVIIFIVHTELSWLPPGKCSPNCAVLKDAWNKLVGHPTLEVWSISGYLIVLNQMIFLDHDSAGCGCHRNCHIHAC